MSSDTSKYNGWTNYATWRVNLEIFDGFELHEWFDEKPDLAAVSNWCIEYAEEAISSCVPEGHIAIDYALAFISDVNWREIAQHLLDDAAFPSADIILDE